MVDFLIAREILSALQQLVVQEHWSSFVPYFTNEEWMTNNHGPTLSKIDCVK